MKKFGVISLYACLLFSLTGCNAIGSKSGSMSILYIVTAVVSFLLLAGYCCLIRKKEPWFLLLFSSVFVVNTGYLTLALSSSVSEALMANRLSYLGSVCLPMSMLMVIMKACRLNYRKWFPCLLTVLGAAVFLISASPGYLDIYYKEVSLSTIRGATVLEKVYGPWHSVYLFYLLGYFGVTAAAIAYASVSKKIDSPTHAVFLAAILFINMGVWLLEQLVKVDFELLSISYILSELFLLGICMVLQEFSPLHATPSQPISEDAGVAAEKENAEPTEAALDAKPLLDERCEFFLSQLPRLTPTERIIYDFYLEGKSTKEIMAELSIKENTLKYHNKNIYGKLGVSSRKQLVSIAEAVRASGDSEN